MQGVGKKETYHVVSQGVVGFTSASQTSQRIVHARAHEADKCDQAQLETRGGVPGHGPAANAQGLVHPSSGANGLGNGVALIVRLMLGANMGRFGTEISHCDPKLEVE